MIGSDRILASDAALENLEVVELEETHSRRVANYLISNGYRFLRVDVVHRKHHLAPLIRSVVYILARPAGVERVEVDRDLMRRLYDGEPKP